jgi:hypothetical protein
MPFVSKSQQRWAYTPAGTKALGGKSKVSEWQSATNEGSLPEKVGSPKKKGLRMPRKGVK